MMAGTALLYSVAYLLVAVLAAGNLAAYRRLRNKTGICQVRWSSLFHLGFIENTLILAVVLVMAAWSVLLIVRSPGSQDGYRRLLLLAAGLALSPRRNVVVGKKGVVYKLRFIPWASVRTKAYFRKGSRVLLRLLFETRPGSARFQTLTLPLPKRVRLSRSYDVP